MEDKRNMMHYKLVKLVLHLHVQVYVGTSYGASNCLRLQVMGPTMQIQTSGTKHVYTCSQSSAMGV